MLKSNVRSKDKNASHDDGEGNWLISYADMMTLLWGFFVILSAMSVPNKALLEKVKETTAKAMGGKYEKPFQEFGKDLQQVVEAFNLKDSAKIETLSDGVKITLASNSVFESGSATIPPLSIETLKKICEILKNQKTSFKIFVEGHTDDVPIKTAMFPSNWELSSNRANAVIRLFEEEGIPHDFMRPVGFADTEPLVDLKELKDEDLKAARSKNRRIVIRLQQILPDRISKKL